VSGLKDLGLRVVLVEDLLMVLSPQLIQLSLFALHCLSHISKALL